MVRCCPGGLEVRGRDSMGDREADKVAEDRERGGMAGDRNQSTRLTVCKSSYKKISFMSDCFLEG